MKTFATTCMASLLLMPVLASAHAKLLESMPAKDSVLTPAPTEIRLRFNESARLTALSIRNRSATAPTKLVPLPKAAAARFTVALPTLAPGVYTVTYRVMGDDSHVMSGSFGFSITAAPATIPIAATSNLTDGEVRRIDKDAGTITLRHGAILNLGMPGMTMVFALKDRSMLTTLAVGNKVKFHAERANGKLVITELTLEK